LEADDSVPGRRGLDFRQSFDARPPAYSYTGFWWEVERAAKEAGIGHLVFTSFGAPAAVGWMKGHLTRKQIECLVRLVIVHSGHLVTW
jgi:hypothetical protein